MKEAKALCNKQCVALLGERFYTCTYGRQAAEFRSNILFRDFPASSLHLERQYTEDVAKHLQSEVKALKISTVLNTISESQWNF